MQIQSCLCSRGLFLGRDQPVLIGIAGTCVDATETGFLKDPLELVFTPEMILPASASSDNGSVYRDNG